MGDNDNGSIGGSAVGAAAAQHHKVKPGFVYIVQGPAHAPIISLQSSSAQHHLYDLAHFDPANPQQLLLHIDLTLCKKSRTPVELVLVMFEVFMAIKDEAASAVFTRRDECGRLRFEKPSKLKATWDK